MKIISYSHLIASLILGASFLGGCLILTSGPDAPAAVQPVASSLAEDSSPWDKPLLTLDETAGYLGVPKEHLQKLIKVRAGDTDAFPFLIMEGTTYVSKAALDSWVLKVSLEGRIYSNGYIQ